MLTMEHAYRFTDSFRTKLFGQAKRNPGLSACLIYLQWSMQFDAIPLTASAVLPEGEEDEFIREAAIDSVRVHPLSLFR